MPIQKGCTHCGSDQHNTTDCPMMLAEREAFEAAVRFNWASAPLHYIRDALPKNDPRHGQYVDETLQGMWVGWQGRAALGCVQCAPVVPAGYKLVPVKPDIEMVEAGYEASLGQPDRSAHARVIEQYDAMLAASPAPEVPGPRQPEVASADRPRGVGLFGWDSVGLTRQDAPQTPAPDADQIAMDAATAIMALMYGPTPAGGSVQLKAQVQCRVLDAINSATQPAAQHHSGGVTELVEARQGDEVRRLREALQITRDTIDGQLEIIASRAHGNYLDKLPVVRSLKAHRARCDAALSASAGQEVKS